MVLCMRALLQGLKNTAATHILARIGQWAGSIGRIHGYTNNKWTVYVI